jgi:hypothetical protein
VSTASIELATGAGSTTVPVARERFAALDSLRGVAALGVAYGHFYGPQILEGTRHFSFYLLVDLFFVLSGFVLAHRYLDDWLARWSRCRGSPAIVSRGSTRCTCTAFSASSSSRSCARRCMRRRPRRSSRR